MAQKRLAKKARPIPTRRKAAPKRSRAAARKAGAAPPAMPSAKQQFLMAFENEHRTTLKVIRALPSDQGHFQPHPRSQTAKNLIWTFTIEQGIAVNALKGTLTMPPVFPPAPASLEEAVSAFEKAAADTIATAKRAPEDRFHRTSPFFSGPGKVSDFRNIDLLWFMLSDQIHHRGQLSVYVRMAGGKVPSIYGPSADEPWM
jgi:uncharacterized damage-inducible protein DinB